MALPTTNLSISQVASTLGYPVSYDIGTLCIHPNINKYSRWKPIRYNKVTGISEYEIIQARSGIDIPIFNNFNDLINLYRAGGEIWGYLRPRGGAYNEPFRVGDFRNYDHAATTHYLIDAISGNKFKSDLLPVTIGNNGSVYGTRLDWGLLQLEGYHFGSVALRKGFNSPIGMGISTQNIGISPSNEARLNLNTSSFIIDYTYEVFTFLCALDGEGTQSGNITGFIPLEAPKAGEFTLRLNRINVQLSATVIGGDELSGYDIKYELKLENIDTSGTAISVSNVTVKIRYGNNPQGSALQLGEFEFPLGNIAVSPGAVVTRTGTAVGALPNLTTRGGVVYFQNTYNSDINTSADIAR